MAQGKAVAYVASVATEGSFDYLTYRLQIFTQDPRAQWSVKPAVIVVWQGNARPNADGSPNLWYSRQVELGYDANSAADLRRAAAALDWIERRIKWPEDSYNWTVQPSDYLGALEKANATELIHDSRYSDWTTPAAIKPEEWQPWYTLNAKDNNALTIVAPDEQAAKAAALVELARRAADPEECRYTDYGVILESWLSRGRPMRRGYDHGHRPGWTRDARQKATLQQPEPAEPLLTDAQINTVLAETAAE